jgi:DNA/RNA endonuclease YhcR with UshA esterase domain
VENNENAEVNATFEGKEATKTIEVIDLMNNYSIKKIQGENESSPYLNQTVSVSGIITAVCPDGYFIQDASEEWCGIYVNDQLENNFSIGNGITVTGIVEENQGNTQIIGVSDFSAQNLDIEIDSLPIPADESLSEKYEGVLVSVHGLRSKELTSSYSYYGEWILEGENNLELIVDDLMYKHEPIVGDYYKVTGVVNFSSGKYKLEPRSYKDVVNLATVNINEVAAGLFEINLYPNPTLGEVNIDMKSATPSKIQVVVMNISGSEVFRKEYTATDKIWFDLSDHVSGMYFVKIKTNKGEIVKKLILNRK